MNKYLLLILLLLAAGRVSAQKKGSFLHLIKSESSVEIKKNGTDLFRIYKAVFQQDNLILSSDSAYFYPQQNACDAFGHVIITQGDTLHVFGDKLHYEGNTKIAIMTDNVRMIDKDAVLTTNYLTYNTATRFGTYTGGGKLVNKDNTLTSKNGYYFTSSRDAYFRYDVVLNTTDAIIKTDTLRYNSGSRIAYFYGPTNIYGKKDKDTLYTENGTYNTQTEQAFFGKKNQYRQGTKSLKGDSLFYDRLIGYGKAVKHVTFYDSEQKIIMHGDLGEYFKKTERMLMTQHPYVVFITESKDTSKTTNSDALKSDSILLKPKTGIVKKPATIPPKNTIPAVTDSQIKTATDLATMALNTLPAAKKDSLVNQAKAAIVKKPAMLPPKNSMALIDSAKLRAAKDPLAKNTLLKNLPPIKADTMRFKKDTSHIKRDSLFFAGDTLETLVMVNRDLKILKEKRRLAAVHDTSIKVVPTIVYTKPVKHLDIAPLRMRADTLSLHKNYFNKLFVRDTTKRKAVAVVPKKAAKPQPKKYVGIDSVNISQDVILSDTARVRVLFAYHHAKLYKSDLQAKADSIFFSYADSVARMYVHPMIWVQDSQLSADTINLQMKHKQLDNLDMSPSSFIVNIEKRDSIHFNQVGGKKMRGFFKNSKMDKMFVFGNAETIYFDRDSGKVTQIHRTISSKIRVTFKSNSPMTVTWYVKPDARILPMDNKLKDEDKMLKGFLWKPEERPLSKEDVINPKKKPIVKKSSDKKTTDKGTPKDGVKPATGEKDTPIAPPIKLGADGVKIKTDTLQHLKLKVDTSKVKLKTDTLKRIKLKTDTTKIKKANEPARQ